jgi:uncharacterized coiled-coil protein SlyX
LRTPEGKPLSVNHVRRVLPVKDPKRRRELLELAAGKGWSVSRLGREVSLARPAASKPDPGQKRPGPEVKPPGDLADALAEITRWGEEWLTRYDSVWVLDKHWPPSLGLGDKTPHELAEMVLEVRGSLERLRKSSAALDRRLKALEESLHPESANQAGRKKGAG